MDFNWSPEDEAFRHELRSWLAANVPKDHAGDDGLGMTHEEGGEWSRRVAWHKKANAAGLVGISWPKEYGGRGANLVQQIIYNEEVARANPPMLVNGLGILLVG